MTMSKNQGIDIKIKDIGIHLLWAKNYSSELDPLLLIDSRHPENTQK
jgi:hypothetical protein